VPLTQPIDKVFETLQKSRKHIALVLDEHGWVEWIITLEDIIEEVFWDIKDETDKEDIYLSKLKDWKILASWNVMIDDVLEEMRIGDIMDIWLDEDFIWENLSYIITSRLERFAENGEVIEFIGKTKNLRLIVKNVSGWKIGQIVVEKF
jgi:putative hemolysin